MVVDGTMVDIRAYDAFMAVTMDANDDRKQSLRPTNVLVYLDIADKATIDHLDRGNPVRFEGQIDMIDQSLLLLRAGRLLTETRARSLMPSGPCWP